MWINAQGGLYTGDKAVGDRKATDAEIASHQKQIDDRVPAEVRSGQMILALHELGFFDAVEAAVAQMPRIAKVLWARASIFDRDNYLLAVAAQMAGMTSADVDAVFRLAATK